MLDPRGRVAARTLTTVVLLGGWSGCASDRTPESPAGAVFVRDAPDVAAMTALPDGGLLLGDRRRGTITSVDAAGVDRGVVASVPVSTDGQRGLLGLAVDGDAVYAAWTDVAGVLTVGQVAPGGTRTIWTGPASADLANGGHLELDDGRLLIGLGDLQDPPRTSDPAAVNGKLLRLDPAGRPDQVPEVVADNAFGGRAERLARGDGGRPSQVTELPEDTAPSGLAPVGTRSVVLCSFLRTELSRWRLDDDGRMRPDGVVARGCRLGVTALADGRLDFSTGTQIRVVDSP